MKAGVDYVGVSTPFYCHDGKGNFLLHKRSEKCRDERGVWDSGAGKLEHGLTPKENVLKEISEEYGCVGVIDDMDLGYYSRIVSENGIKLHWIAIPFFVRVDPNEAKNNEVESIDYIKWFKLNEFPEPLHTGLKIALEKFKDKFEYFGSLK